MCKFWLSIFSLVFIFFPAISSSQIRLGDDLKIVRVYENLGGLYTHVIVESSYSGRVKCSLHDKAGEVIVVSEETVEAPLTGLIFISGDKSSEVVSAKCWKKI